MAVLVDANTRLMVQGIGTEGANHMRRSIAYGTNVVAAIHPKRGGEQQDGVTIFPTVDQGVRETGANVTIIDKNVERLRFLDQVLHGRSHTLASNTHNLQEKIAQTIVCRLFTGTPSMEKVGS